MNNITIELCAEDRARLDKLTDALEARVAQVRYCITNGLLTIDEAPDEVNEALKQVLADAEEASAKAAKKPQDEAEAPNPTENPTEALNEAQAEPAKATQAEEPKKPTVTMQMLTNKAITLSAAGKKDQVRDVVHQYAKTVTSLPADKWDEVWEKLNELEG